MAALATRRFERAQVSLEFLVLMAAFLAFLLVWLSLILDVKKGIDGSLSFSLLMATASDLREAADAVCLMGPGSSKEVAIKAGAAVELSGREMRVSSSGKVASLALRCETIGGKDKLAGNSAVVFQNEEGKIKMKNRESR